MLSSARTFDRLTCLLSSIRNVADLLVHVRIAFVEQHKDLRQTDLFVEQRKDLRQTDLFVEQRKDLG